MIANGSSGRILVVSNDTYLQPANGGVQWCTREYVDILSATGRNVSFFSYHADQRLHSRLLRRLRPKPFQQIMQGSVVDQLVSHVRLGGFQWIALNNTEACALAESLRSRLPGCGLIFLSHGAESTDLLNQLRLDPTSLPPYMRLGGWIGRTLLAELHQRRALDATVCISAEDLVFERWLGSPNVLFLPRLVTPVALERSPQRGKIGTVATLNHTPNRNGIVALARALSSKGVQLRLVGGPEAIGFELQRRFPCIHYCGRLDDAALIEEAAGWCAFVNPIFCQARGASTKVATALGWGLPVLSTPLGVRGYRWDIAALPLAENPEQLAKLCTHLALEAATDEWSSRARRVIDLAPSASESASTLNAFLARMESSGLIARARSVDP